MKTISILLQLLGITSSALAQIAISFDSPKYAEYLAPESNIAVDFSIADNGEPIDKVELILDKGKQIIDLTGKEYAYDFSGLRSGYHQLEVKVTSSGNDTTEILPVIVDHPPFPECEKPESNGKLKVFILAGQSNMVGFGTISQANVAHGTLVNLAEEKPEKYASLLVNDNDVAQRDDVWLVWDDKKGVHGSIKGAVANTVGPEYGFGNVMGEHFDDPVLVIKCAWGGKSLCVDFLPPSAWDYKEPNNEGDTGYFYNEIITKVKDVLNNLPTYYQGKAYDDYEILGFGWHQGWNDRVSAQCVKVYEENLVHLIQDLRKDLEVPDMPFSIANSGFDGWLVIPSRYRDRVERHVAAQLAVGDTIKYPDFIGNVDTVQTRGYYRSPIISPSTRQDYHWFRNFETYYLIGEGLAHSLIKMNKEPEEVDTGGTNHINENNLAVEFKIVSGNLEIILQDDSPTDIKIIDLLGKEIVYGSFVNNTSFELSENKIFLLSLKNQNGVLRKKIYMHQ